MHLLKNKFRNVFNNSSDVSRSSTNSPIVLVTMRICSRLSANDTGAEREEHVKALCYLEFSTTGWNLWTRYSLSAFLH